MNVLLHDKSNSTGSKSFSFFVLLTRYHNHDILDIKLLLKIQKVLFKIYLNLSLLQSIRITRIYHYDEKVITAHD